METGGTVVVLVSMALTAELSRALLSSGNTEKSF